MMKKALLAGAMSLFTVSAAQAADVVAPEAFDWTGPYIGLQGGYAWGQNDLSISEAPLPLLLDAKAAVVNGRDGTIDLDGFIGGAHAGYNLQMDSLVLGLEGDIEYSDLRGNGKVLTTLGDPGGGDKERVDWLGSLRLRAGFAVDRALFYGTGGLAAGGAKLSAYNSGGTTFADDSETKWGWTLGAGIEYAFTDNLSARIEYRYTDLGTIKADYDSGQDKADIAFHAVRAGLSWHF